MKTIETRPRTLEHTFKTRLTHLRQRIVHVRAEKLCTVKLPLAKRFKAWRMGFTSASYAIYGLDKQKPDDYLRDFSDINYTLNNPGAHSVNNKFTFSNMMTRATIPTPGIIALINGGSIAYPIRQDAPDRGDLTANVDAWLEHYGKLVFRPTCGGGGAGVFFMDRSGGRLTVNREPQDLVDVCSYLKRQSSYLVTEFVEQANYARRIYPDVTNTVRVLTIWDSITKHPVITNAAHRFGSSRSFPVDNFHGGLGGLCSPIDLNSGELGPGLRLSESGSLFHHNKHPETEGQIAGIKIPNWEKVKQLILEAAKTCAVSPYIGWDIIITEQGCSFIEGNSPPGVMVWQVHNPLLRDLRLKRFYMEQGMIH
ncbi:MAG: sugar-transfer associated ATP-grasp domain-containing protein [Pseudomonadota bacterium]